MVPEHVLVTVHQPRAIEWAGNLAPSPHTSILPLALLMLLTPSNASDAPRHCLQGHTLLLREAAQASSTPAPIWASNVTFGQVPSLLCLNGFLHPFHCVLAPCLQMLLPLPQDCTVPHTLPTPPHPPPICSRFLPPHSLSKYRGVFICQSRACLSDASHGEMNSTEAINLDPHSQLPLGV